MNDRAINARELAANQNQFYDVSYSKLITNPADIMRKIYEHFGLAYSEKFDMKMEKWLSDYQKNKHGQHN
jgi:hypothetical protein